MKKWPLLLTLLTAAILLTGRWTGPSDLFDNDQPKTVAYTVDMVRNGRWLLPVDMLGRPATKPPMYNWLGAPAVALGWHNEFALKLPSTLAGIVTIVLTWLAGTSTARELRKHHAIDDTGVWDDGVFSAISCIALLSTYSFAKLCYTARPDMVLTAFLLAGWVLGTKLLSREETDRDFANKFCTQSGFWLCVVGAALTKGPPALLLVLYVLLGSKLLTGRWSAIKHTGITWGLPLACMVVGMWSWGVYRVDPEHFRQVFMGDETIGRVGRGGVVGILSECWKMPAMFIAKFLPWSVFAVMAICHVIRTRPRSMWLDGATGPSIVWVLLVVVFFSLSGGKRADYLMPAYPMGAILAAYWLLSDGVRLRNLRPWQPVILGLVLVIGFVTYDRTLSSAARTDYGNRVVSFTKQVAERINGQPVAFRNTRYTPIQSLLGHNDPPGEKHESSRALWLIKPVDDTAPLIQSEPIWVGGKDHEIIFGLYQAEQNADKSK
ncbi:MAG: hypothetical protein Kow00105_09020 [Phycisphaeraceae bacterium]